MSSKFVMGALTGVAGGFIFGTVGWGGAQVIKPSLSGFLNLSTIQTSGVSLTSLSCASTISATKFFANDSADVVVALAIALPGVVGARIGIRLAEKMSGELLALIFNGMSVLLIPTHFFVQQYRKRNPHQSTEPVPTPNLERIWTSPNDSLMLQHAAFGLFSGILSALMGVGGAPLTISYLTLNTTLPHHLVQGTMIMSAAPAVLTSAVSLGLGGHVPFGLAAAVCCGSMTGSLVGSSFALQLSESQLRQLFIISLVVLGGRSFVAAIFNIRNLMKL